MPINSSNHKLGDLYSNIYKKKQNQINESTRSQVVKESLKSNYFSSTPFHKYLNDYDQMYSGYRSSVILKESYKNDINTAMYLMQRNPELCNEIFGAIGQKIKQGVQAGAQAVQSKLLQPIINMIISKLPKAKQEELAKAAEGGEQALQQFIQKEGDPSVSNQVSSQNAPVAESRDHELMHAYQILSILTMNTSGVLSEDAAQNKFKNFQKTLNQIASEIKDPNIQQQAQALSSYIQQNYTTRGTVKGAAKPGAAPAQQTPVAPKAGGAGPLAPAGGQAGPLATTSPGGEINVTPGGPQRAPTTATASTASAAPTAQGGSSSLIGKIGSFIKNNPKLSAAAAIGLIGAIGVASGGLGFVAPMLLPALKSAGVGAAVGAATGAMKAKPGERLKGALKGAAAGGAIAGAGSLVGQAVGGMGGGGAVDTGSEVNPNTQSPESLGTAEAPVDTGSEVNPNAQSPEGLGNGGYEEPTGQEEVSPTQGTEEAGAAEMAGAGQSSEGTGEGDEYTSAQGGATPQAQPATAAKGAEAFGNQQAQAQAQKAQANLQPGEVLKKDTLGRTFRVKAK